MREVLSKNAFRQYLRMNPRKFECPICGVVVTLPRQFHSPETIKCDLGHRLCGYCKKVSHEGFCEEAFQPNKSRNLVNRACPVCKTNVIQQCNGAYAINCQACDNRFCWVCGKDRPNGEDERHYLCDLAITNRTDLRRSCIIFFFWPIYYLTLFPFRLAMKGMFTCCLDKFDDRRLWIPLVLLVISCYLFCWLLFPIAMPLGYCVMGPYMIMTARFLTR